MREAFNAVFVEAEAAGELMFYGRGAGGDPTASAVLGDVVAVARHRVAGGRGPGESAYADLPVVDLGQAVTRYHISLDVADRPGVLAQVAAAFAEHGVSIETVRQQARPEGEGRGQARSSSPTARATPRSPRPSTPSRRSTPSTTSSPSCAWKEPEPWRTSGAE